MCSVSQVQSSSPLEEFTLRNYFIHLLFIHSIIHLFIYHLFRQSFCLDLTVVELTMCTRLASSSTSFRFSSAGIKGVFLYAALGTVYKAYFPDVSQVSLRFGLAWCLHSPYPCHPCPDSVTCVARATVIGRGHEMKCKLLNCHGKSVLLEESL